MPKDTPQVDHKAKALNGIEAAFELGAKNGQDDAIPILLAEAQVYSNLAIAEGQDRVAEELKSTRKLLSRAINERAAPLV